MKKVVGVTKAVYELCRALEKVEDKVEFSVFYSFAEILESHHFCPGFTFNDIYYEIQYDDENRLQVLDFGIKGNRIVGEEMTDRYIEDLTKNINLWK